MNIKINSLYLKLFAVCFMTVDHVAYYFLLPNSEVYIIMRMIGRLAAPLFWFCFVEGYKRTSNRNRYKLRLLIAASIMSVGNLLLHALLGLDKLSILIPNMFLSFLISALIIDTIEDCIKSKEQIKIISLFVLSVILIVFACKFCEYSYFIVSFILVFYFIKNNTIKNILFVVSATILSIVEKNFLQIFSILAVLFFVNYDNSKPKYSFKYLFYLFYPLHIWLFVVSAFLF